ncbi:MAG: hypothetical protein ABWX65_01800, partial [Mycetocola sp.]
DPLIRRNAHLNLEKLGVTVRSYLPDFYGRLDDNISGADNTDRFEVSWTLDSPEVEAAVQRSIDRAGSIATYPGPVKVAHDHGIRFELHADYEELRRTDPAAAAEFRDASRAVFGPAFDEGLSVTFVDGGYVFA